MQHQDKMFDKLMITMTILNHQTRQVLRRECQNRNGDFSIVSYSRKDESHSLVAIPSFHHSWMLTKNYFLLSENINISHCFSYPCDTCDKIIDQSPFTGATSFDFRDFRLGWYDMSISPFRWRRCKLFTKPAPKYWIQYLGSDEEATHLLWSVDLLQSLQ